MTLPETDVFDRIRRQITENKVVLYLKGTPQGPQCGFSAQVVRILKDLDVQFLGVNVLEDPQLRQGIKDFSDWPTIPQLYICGEFIGGCDIVTESYRSGELETLLNQCLTA